MRAGLQLACVLILMCTACSAGTVAPTTPVGVSSTTTTSTEVVSTTTSSLATTTSEPTTTSTIEPLPLAGATVVIDPGHNGMNWAHLDEINQPVDIGNGTKPCNTTGASTSAGYAEADFTWALAQLVLPLLEDLGAEVILTRADNDGWGPCITERAAIGNRNQADAVISIHADGGPAEGRGFHVIHPANTAGLTDDIHEESHRLAVALHGAFMATAMPVADYIAENGFSERDDLGGLNLSDVPAVFLEAGNMRNATDAALLADPAFQAVAAQAIVAAVTVFLTD